jgi:mevalonate kinase
VKSSAPGKIILFGEHAVVYGRAALAVPVTQVQAQADVSASSRPGIWIEAPDIGLQAELNSLPADHPLAAAVRKVLSTLDADPIPDLQIKISSTIPVAAGLGSGAAVTVALLRALASELGHGSSDEQVNSWAFEIEKLHHGTPSGIDNTVVTYARPVYFVKGQPPEPIQVGQPFTVVIGDTGVPAPTMDSVADVRRLWTGDRARYESIFDEIDGLTRAARQAIQNGHWKSLGQWMDKNHALLQILTVSSPDLDRLVEAARRAGARGAKLSGGGRGGNMIALVDPGRAGNVAGQLMRAGALRTFVTQIN